MPSRVDVGPKTVVEFISISPCAEVLASVDVRQTVVRYLPDVCISARKVGTRSSDADSEPVSLRHLFDVGPLADIYENL